MTAKYQFNTARDLARFTRIGNWIPASGIRIEASKDNMTLILRGSRDDFVTFEIDGVKKLTPKSWVERLVTQVDSINFGTSVYSKDKDETDRECIRGTMRTASVIRELWKLQIS